MPRSWLYGDTVGEGTRRVGLHPVEVVNALECHKVQCEGVESHDVIDIINGDQNQSTFIYQGLSRSEDALLIC